MQPSESLAAKDESPNRVSRRFRSELKRELAQWEQQDVLSSAQSQVLRQRYALDNIDDEGRSLLISTVYLVGATLIGLGAISFVAAHWADIPKPFKIIALLSALLAAHGGGYYFLRLRGHRPLLGQALIMLGTLIYGANIGLMAQIFHIKSHTYNGFAAWAFGAWIMAYALFSVPNALIALVVSVVFYGTWIDDTQQPMAFFALLLLTLALPIAYKSRSALLFLFALAAGAGIACVDVAVHCDDSMPSTLLGVSVIFFALIALATLHITRYPRPEASSPALFISSSFAAVVCFLLAFAEVAEELGRDSMNFSALSQPGMLVLMLPLALLAVGALFLSARSWKSRQPLGPLVLANLSVAIAFVLMATWHNSLFIVVTANIAVLLMGAGTIAAGVRSQRRRLFWGGAILVALTIMSRFLEYDTGLLLKSVAFIAIGVAVIYGGLRFENSVRKEVSHA